MPDVLSGSYSSLVTLNPGQPDVTVSGVINAYGPGGAYLVQNNGSLVSQTIYGALFGPAGTVFSITNSGTIETQGTAANPFDVGIGLGTPGTVWNSGTVLGGTGIGMLGTMVAGQAGYVGNTGVIAGTVGSGIYLSAGRVVDSGTISGVYNGVEIHAAGAYVSNAATGLILATKGYGIASSSGGTVENAGTVAGFVYGVAAGGALTVRNAGEIVQFGTGTAGSNYAGIYLLQGGNVLNSLTGVISGATGVRFGGTQPGYVDNAGTIHGGHGAAVYFNEGGTVVNNGVIAGVHHGIVDEGIGGGAGGHIENAGLILSTANTFVSNGISHTGGGIALLAGGAVANQAAGTIIGANGVYLTGGSLGAALTLENAGLIQGTYKSGLVLESAAYAGNSGTIHGKINGVNAQGGGITLVNTGVITGGTNGVVATIANTRIVDTGSILGTAGVGIALKGGGTLLTSGTISGGGGAAVYFGTGASRLVLESGAKFGGAVVASPSFGGNLELGGSLTGAFDMGGTVSGFNRITFDSGSHWSLEGNAAELASPGVGISGFALGDTLVLDGFTATSETFNSAVHALDLFGNGGVEQLTLLGSFSTGSFLIQTVGTGTQIELCYLRGTNILTPQGERPVEDLRAGDLVVTRFAGVQPVKWIGEQRYAARFLADNPGKRPVRIKPGALGGNLPVRDLNVSPGHALLLGDTLVLAKNLVNGVTVTQDDMPDVVEYFGVELETHDCLIAEGAFAESFADGPGLRNQFHNAAQFYARFPDYAEPETITLCAARPERGPELYRALRPIVAQAAALIAPGPLRGSIDVIDNAGRIEGWAQDTANPELPVLLEIMQGDAVIGTVLACDERDDLLAAHIGNGRCMFTFITPTPLPPDVQIRRAQDQAKLHVSDACQARIGNQRAVG